MQAIHEGRGCFARPRWRLRCQQGHFCQHQTQFHCFSVAISFSTFAKFYCFFSTSFFKLTPPSPSLPRPPSCQVSFVIPWLLFNSADGHHPLHCYQFGANALSDSYGCPIHTHPYTHIPILSVVVIQALLPGRGLTDCPTVVLFFGLCCYLDFLKSLVED